MTTVYDGLPFPRTDLARAATQFARENVHAAIFNHSMRTYLYGRFLGEHRGLRPDEDYDDELLFLGCVLHDVGLGPKGNGDQRFDIDGADLAAEFLTKQGVDPERIEVVWDAVALHLYFEVASRKQPEIALVTEGAGYDLGPTGPALPPGYADRVHAVLPRLHTGAVLYDLVVEQALAKPQKAPLFSFPGELVRQKTGDAWPTWRQLMDKEPSWHDYDGYRPRTG
ncbi:HD domain-containing protein [Streptoalloteichus hindustanus]|uniref:HD domain-containing protein n=1 Tax=Streptoalloteichus hindustanus TaxID=2017 RepID=A0A1M5MG58_STRHI|nr:HD domain-containing protein [Streptoalloteichus hindustanus]SHG76310.1 HD domain-containing protein [Streptoalloteichus hindustanus]